MISPDPESSGRRIPLYRQVAEVISRRFIDGLSPGVRLPSERELSQMMEVSMATIRAALGELEAKGRVERRLGSGTYTLEAPDLSRRHVAVLMEADIASPKLSPFFPRLLQEVRQELLKQNIPSRPYLGHLHLGLEIGELTCRDFFDDLRYDRISGVISVLSRKHVSWQSELRKRGIPVVGARRASDHVVEIDCKAALSAALSAMREAGCRHLAVVALKNDYTSLFETLATKIAPEFGLQLSLTRAPINPVPADLEEFRSFWTPGGPGPDCLFVGDDTLLPAVEQALEDVNAPLLPVECCYVYGSDALPLAARRPITHCTYSTRLKAVKLVEALRSLMAGEQIPELTEIPVSFVQMGGPRLPLQIK